MKWTLWCADIDGRIGFLWQIGSKGPGAHEIFVSKEERREDGGPRKKYPTHKTTRKAMPQAAWRQRQTKIERRIAGWAEGMSYCFGWFLFFWHFLFSRPTQVAPRSLLGTTITTTTITTTFTTVQLQLQLQLQLQHQPTTQLQLQQQLQLQLQLQQLQLQLQQQLQLQRLLQILIGSDVLRPCVCYPRGCAAPGRVPCQGNTQERLRKRKTDSSLRKIIVTCKSPVGDISAVTLIRTDTTLDLYY